MLPNMPEFAVIYYGVLRAGGVVVPMNPLLKAREVTHYLNDSGARLIFAGPECPDEALAGAEYVIVDRAFDQVLDAASPFVPVVDREHTDTAVILYTSGTTGQPKGAELTHGNLSTNVEVTATDLIQVRSDDVIFGGLPLFHSFGQTCGLNTAVTVGASLTLVSRFTPEKAFQVLARDRVTVFEGVPTMYVALLAAADRLEYCGCAYRAGRPCRSTCFAASRRRSAA